jgi:hypothetical protein
VRLAVKETIRELSNARGIDVGGSAPRRRQMLVAADAGRIGHSAAGSGSHCHRHERVPSRMVPEVGGSASGGATGRFRAKISLDFVLVLF